MAVTAKNFRDRFPEFSELKNTDIDIVLGLGLRRVSSTPDGALRDDAVGYGAAHYAEESSFGEDGRIVVSPGDTDLDSTKYGRILKSYVRMLTPTIMVV